MTRRCLRCTRSRGKVAAGNAGAAILGAEELDADGRAGGIFEVELVAVGARRRAKAAEAAGEGEDQGGQEEWSHGGGVREKGGWFNAEMGCGLGVQKWIYK